MAYRNLYIEANNVFKNRTFDDLLKPLAMYTDVYNQLEAESGELADKSNAFAYLSSTLPEGSESRRIYENYANELKAASDDMARNGLNIQNRRALVDLKRRYNGEIGRLQKADEALQKEKELRRNASMKDPSMLYANDNLTIDNFLEGSNPNLYSISGNDLYKRGATASQQASSRVYDNTQVQNLTKYYQEMIQRYGYNPELLYAFREDLSAIPELEAEVDSILRETGVEDNLTGNNYARARESVINGMIDGALYKEERKAMQNPGVLTAAQAAQDARQREAADRQNKAFKFGLLQQGFTEDADGNIVPMQNNPLYTTDENGRIKLRDDIDPSKFGISSSGNLTYGNGGNNGGNVPTDADGKPLEKIPKELFDYYRNEASALQKLNTEHLKKGSTGVITPNGFVLKANGRQKVYKIVYGVRHDSSKNAWLSNTVGNDAQNTISNWTASNIVDGSGNIGLAAPKKARVLINDIDEWGRPTESDEFQYLPPDAHKEIDDFISALRESTGKDVDYQIIEVQSEGNSRPHYMVAVAE